jgi:alginate O-acetyltransferase complex protein AlgI
MLFNSTVFLYGFLPLTAAAFFLAGNEERARYALVLASIIFYGWWSPPFLLLILIGVVINFCFSRYLLRAPDGANRKAALILAIVINLLPLLFFKYYRFIVENLGILFDQPLRGFDVILPLAISFYTFQKIALVIDSYRRQIPDVSLTSYALFVLFFPHLIAGPITSPREMLPQFEDPKSYRLRLDNFAMGFSIFIIGLFKKVVIADTVAQYATPVFAAASQGKSLSFIDAWSGALAYTFQLYFDFSGYSEMALGLARMFNIRMPINFYSPYRATSIRDFWRRWHMSLSWFLREYVYIPLGGNRSSYPRTLANLMFTMLLAGIWHGAGWTFVIFGFIHGLYLVLNTIWLRLKINLGYHPLNLVLSWLVTFVAVVVGWVFFRAETVDAALRILAGMSGVNGIVLPLSYAPHLPFLTRWGVEFGQLYFFAGWPELFLLTALLLVVLVLPNVPEVFRIKDLPFIERRFSEAAFLVWKPSFAWACAVGILAYFALSGIDGYSEFLYFNF